MKFVVEIDTATKAGSDALNYLKELKTSNKVIYIRKKTGKTTVPLSPEEMALPFGKTPTKEELELFLNAKQGRGKNAEAVRSSVLKKLAQSRKR